MARPITLTKQLAASSANNIVTSVIPTSGTALTLNGSTVSGGVATLDTARRVLLTYGNEGSDRTLVLTGTMEGGNVITETLTVPSGGAGTVASTQDFLTITRAVPAGGGWTAAITLGTNGVGSTRWVGLNEHITPFLVGAQGEILSGAANWTLEVTLDRFMQPLGIYSAGYSKVMPVPVAVGWSGMTAQAGSATSTINQPARAARLTVNSGTGSVQMTIAQAGIRN